MASTRSLSLIIATAVVAVIALCVAWGLFARHLQDARHANPPARRFEVVVTGTFVDKLQTYSGASASAPDGELVAWCGHRSSDLSASGLVYMHLPDEALRVIKCVGPGPDGFEYSSAVCDPDSKIFYCSTTGEHLLIGGRVSTTVGNFYDRGRLVAKDVRLKVRPATN